MKKFSINLDKVDMSRVHPGKNGTGRYLDCVEIPTPNDTHGNDFMVVQDVSKEEREEGKKGPIIGNGRETSKPRS